MSSRKSFYINSHGPDPNAIKTGLLWLLDQGKTSGGGFIAVQVIRNLDGVIRNILGCDRVKNRKKQHQVTINGVTISLITKKKMPYSVHDKSIFVVYPSESMLDKIDSIEDIKDILVCPWIFNEIENWITTWNATELGKPSTNNISIENLVVVQALKSLTNCVNVSTGISHPSDRSAAIWTFRILKQNNENFYPAKVKSWLISQGHWNAVDAEEVAKIASGVLEGKSFRAGTCIWRNGIINIWRKEAGIKPE